MCSQQGTIIKGNSWPVLVSLAAGRTDSLVFPTVFKRALGHCLQRNQQNIVKNGKECFRLASGQSLSLSFQGFPVSTKQETWSQQTAKKHLNQSRRRKPVPSASPNVSLNIEGVTDEAKDALQFQLQVAYQDGRTIKAEEDIGGCYRDREATGNLRESRQGMTPISISVS